MQGYDKYYLEVICILKSSQIIVKLHNEIVAFSFDMDPTLAWYSSTIYLALFFQWFITSLLLSQIACYFSRVLKAAESYKVFFCSGLFVYLVVLKVFLNPSDCR